MIFTNFLPDTWAYTVFAWSGFSLVILTSMSFLWVYLLGLALALLSSDLINCVAHYVCRFAWLYFHIVLYPKPKAFWQSTFTHINIKEKMFSSEYFIISRPRANRKMPAVAGFRTSDLRITRSTLNQLDYTVRWIWDWKLWTILYYRMS